MPSRLQQDTQVSVCQSFTWIPAGHSDYSDFVLHEPQERMCVAFICVFTVGEKHV
jgi:hypothetical protein